MTRSFTPVRDLIALFQLWRHLCRIRPHIVHAHTPKAGLLGMTAAWLAGVPIHVYHVHGLPLMTLFGLKRTISRWAEKVSCRLSDQVLCVSRSVRDLAVAEHLCPEKKIKVLAGGSINGVDAAERFNPERVGNQCRERVRKAIGIPSEALVVGFVGRIVRDKGVLELAEAWKLLRDDFPSLHLVLAGRFEPQDPVGPQVERLFRDQDRIHLAGYVADTPSLYAAMDVLAFPSYREGFPYAPLESAAMALPVVATRVPGCVNAVQDGVTGTLVPARDAHALAGAIKTYVQEPDLRRRHGQAGRERVLRDFRQKPIWEATYQEYVRLLREKRLPCPERLAAPDVTSPVA